MPAADGAPMVISFSTCPLRLVQRGRPLAVVRWLELDPSCRCTMPTWPLLNSTRKPLLPGPMERPRTSMSSAPSFRMDEDFRMRACTYSGALCSTARPEKLCVGRCWK